VKAALAVDRLLGAGAVAFETSSVAPMLADWHSSDAIYGVTSNPNDVFLLLSIAPPEASFARVMKTLKGPA
jgi:hypothetical protein